MQSVLVESFPFLMKPLVQPNSKWLEHRRAEIGSVPSVLRSQKVKEDHPEQRVPLSYPLLGPLITGFLQEAVSLKVTLLIISFFALSLSAAGTFLRRA